MSGVRCHVSDVMCQVSGLEATMVGEECHMTVHIHSSLHGMLLVLYRLEHSHRLTVQFAYWSTQRQLWGKEAGDGGGSGIGNGIGIGNGSGRRDNGGGSGIGIGNGSGIG